MNNNLLRLITAKVIALSMTLPALAQTSLVTAPAVPAGLQTPAGHVPYLKGEATGTQNYVCVPGAGGPAWRFLGPQATLFVTFPWINGQGKQQVATHYLSANPAEDGTLRPTWQGSFDSSVVWGNAVANSSDPKYVAPGAVAWLLLQIVGAERGPMGGTILSQTTYIQRVNTAGGVAPPAAGCDEQNYGKVSLVPYTTDYYFYQAARKN